MCGCGVNHSQPGTRSQSEEDGRAPTSSAAAATAPNPHLLLAGEGGVRGRQLLGGRQRQSRQRPLGHVAGASATHVDPGQLRAPAEFSGAFTFRPV